MKRMSPDDIPAFIEEVMATGCRPIAVGDRMYLIGDGDLPEPARENVQPVLQEIGKRYGDRSHLVEEIVMHLRSLGLTHDLPSTH